MNTTVARIVDLLFENVAESEEVTALHDEVMNNCQERYDDLRSRGLGEDEAIGEVVESLKGMDEVVRQYPRKSDVRESTPRIDAAMEMEDDEEDAQPGCAFPFEQVRMLDVNLSSDDVELVLSQDDLIHVNWEDEEDEIIAELEDDTLRVSRSQQNGSTHRGKHNTYVHRQMDWNGKHINLDDIDKNGDFLKSIRRTLANMAFSGRMVMGGNCVTIAIPHNAHLKATIHTSSGDLTARDIYLQQLRFDSASGDAAVRGIQGLERLAINTASGDVEVDDVATPEPMVVKTVSGDMHLNCACPELQLNTVSGDVEAEGDFEKISAASVSGDLHLDSRNAALKAITTRTTSGDAELLLPREIESVSVQYSTRSGDFSSHGIRMGGDAPCINCTSVSGDIRIRRRD